MHVCETDIFILENTVNELSGTIDLESTLMRAEALFRRFRRLVETIDKMPNFPPPRLAAAKRVTPPKKDSTSGDDAADNSASSPGTAAAGQTTAATSAAAATEATAAPSGERSKKMVTPELRKLLSREVYVLPRKEVVKRAAAPRRRESR
jgi:hypothetical protein